MTGDEWTERARQRCDVRVAMHGIPDAPAVLVGWHRNKWCRVEFMNGARANIRPERVSIDSEHMSPQGRISPTYNEDPVSACDAPGPLQRNTGGSPDGQ